MKTIKVYSARELKDKFPEAFEKVHKKHIDSVSERGIDWQDEIMDSLKGIFKASGIKLNDYSISDTERSYVKFNDEDFGYYEAGDDEILKSESVNKQALKWLKESLSLKSVKRVNYIHEGKKHVRFDVVKSDEKVWDCDFTGYCADYDFLYSLLNDVTKENCTLSEAYHNLADVAGKLFEQEYNDQCSEEYFLDEAEANDYQYTEDGLMI